MKVIYLAVLQLLLYAFLVDGGSKTFTENLDWKDKYWSPMQEARNELSVRMAAPDKFGLSLSDDQIAELQKLKAPFEQIHRGIGQQVTIKTNPKDMKTYKKLFDKEKELYEKWEKGVNITFEDLRKEKLPDIYIGLLEKNDPKDAKKREDIVAFLKRNNIPIPTQSGTNGPRLNSLSKPVTDKPIEKGKSEKDGKRIMIIAGVIVVVIITVGCIAVLKAKSAKNEGNDQAQKLMPPMPPTPPMPQALVITGMLHEEPPKRKRSSVSQSDERRSLTDSDTD